jgi:8-oxo-dGTP pyrophosphatase MutT (NUDIX family)
VAITLRAVSTASHRTFRFVKEYRWTLLGLAVVVIGVVSTFVVIPVSVLVAEAVFSVLLIALEVQKNVREARRTRFLPRPHDSFEDVLEGLARDNGFRVLATQAGTFVHDRRTSERMRSPEQHVRIADRPYVVPAQLQPHAKRFLKDVLANHPHRFNGPCLGWNTNFAEQTRAGQDIEVVEGDHFRFVQSDELSTKDVEVDGRVLPEFGRSLFVSRAGVVRDFRDSWLFNLIGSSTLAITTDGRLVGTMQSESNISSPKLLAPSGSGGVEPKDFRGEPRLTVAQLAINAANRELAEETGIQASEMTRSYLLGFGRWLDMAGRGELLCVTFLNIDSHAVRQKRIRRFEQAYTARTDSLRFAQVLRDWSPAKPSAMLPNEHRSRMSVPLGAALSLLAEESARTGSGVRERLLQLPIGP